MLTIKFQTTFKKDIKRIRKRGYDLSLMEQVVDRLSAGQKLDERYHDHELIGEWKNFRECHITPDWLLIYRIDGDELILFLSRTGTHNDLFGL